MSYLRFLRNEVLVRGGEFILSVTQPVYLEATCWGCNYEQVSGDSHPHTVCSLWDKIPLLIL